MLVSTMLQPKNRTAEAVVSLFKRVSDSEELEAALGVPVLKAVPMFAPLPFCKRINAIVATADTRQIVVIIVSITL